MGRVAEGTRAETYTWVGVDDEEWQLEAGEIATFMGVLQDDDDAVVVLGEDQSALCEKLCATYNLGGQLNRRTGSSTQVRHLMDHGDFDAVEALYRNDPYAFRLALLLRKEELSNGDLPDKTKNLKSV
jgi:predicted signal transduction protein with EAL and GGDEF domain